MRLQRTQPLFNRVFIDEAMNLELNWLRPGRFSTGIAGRT